MPNVITEGGDRNPEIMTLIGKLLKAQQMAFVLNQ